MRGAWRLGAAACLLAVAALSGASTGLGKPAATDCLGVPGTIIGTEGRDELEGTPGRDVIVGNGGDDFIIAFGGNDVLCGGPGNDAIVPGSGDDRVDGGGGGVGPGFIDLVAFDQSTSPVRADLRTGTATGEGTDTLVNVSGLSGTPHADTLVGNPQVNALFPGNGDDLVDGGGGDDTVHFSSAVVANLATGTATGEGSDRLVSLEGLGGSDFADVLIGNRVDNYLAGDRGNDVIQGAGGNDRLFGDHGDDRVLGQAGDDRATGNDGNDRVSAGTGNDTLAGGEGDDRLDGGGGADIVSYRDGRTGVQANLLVGRVTGQGLDSVDGVENLSGSELRDQILGDVQTNFLLGNAGSDRIDAGAGADFLDGGLGPGTLADGAGRDYCLRGGGAGGCEISGNPGPVPQVPDEPRASWVSPGVSTGSSRAGIVMRSPAVQPAVRSRLRALRVKMMRVFGYEEGPSRGPLVSPLPQLFEAATPRGTGPFRYTGQPSCFADKRPYRTTVAPPSEIQPAVPDGDREQVFWRGVLFRQDRRTRKLVRTTATPWVTGIVQGVGIPTGFPVWQNRDEATFVSSFSFKLPAGSYAWVGKLRWVRTGGRVIDFIEPHIVHTQKVQPDKSCTFGGER